MQTLPEGTVIAQRYTVVRVLGRGGMAVVYEVMNSQLGVPCALKVLAITAHSVQQRLAREGTVQAQLAHPNIVSVFDVVDVGGSPGLLMELVRGPSLDALLAETTLTFEQCDALAAGLFAGLGAAHERGLIHRDLKPANILCSVANGMLLPKIADFGLAKVLGDESGANAPGTTRSGTTMGTPSYMAPEQIRNAGRVDQRADLFSAGAILYEMVTGQKAFGGDDLLELFTAVASGRFVKPRELRPELPERMERAILGALEPDRDKRIRDVHTLQLVWSGDRDEWTTELDPSSLGQRTWDPSILARYSVSSVSGERTHGRGRSPFPTPSKRTDETMTADQFSRVEDEEERAPVAAPSSPSASSRSSLGATLSPQGYAVAGGAAVALAGLILLTSLGVGVGVYVWLTSSVAVAEADPPDVPVVPAPPVQPPPPRSVAEDGGSLGPRLLGVPPPEPIAVTPPNDPPHALVPEAAPRPVPKPDPVVDVAPVPDQPPPTPVPEPVPEPVPTPAPVVDALPPGKGRVRLGGDVERVWLQGVDNVPLPAVVDAGTYTIQAFFEANSPVAVGTLVVAPGRELTVSCYHSMKKCK